MRCKSSAKIRASKASGWSCKGGALKTGRFHNTSSRVALRTIAGGSGAGWGGGVGSGRCMGVGPFVVLVVGQRMTFETGNCAASFSQKYFFDHQVRERSRGRKFAVKGSSPYI